MKRVGISYKQRPIDDTYDVIVIGSGIGGMTAAALLSKHAGRKVLVLERHYTAGGFTHAFCRPGYEWDVGVHYIGGVNHPGSELRAVFDHLTEGRLQWNPMPEVYDRIRIADREYDFPSGLENFRDRMNQYFPAETGAIDRYLAAVGAAARASNLYFAEKALPEPMARLLGPLMRLRFLRYAGQTTAQVLKQITRNRELAAVLTGQWGDYGLPPGQSSFGMHAMVADHYLEGASYPVGGASEIAAGIAPLIERAGGQIVNSAEVSEILMDRERCAVGVRMANGRELRAQTIISDAGAFNTFSRLVPAGFSTSLGLLEEVKSIPPSMCHVCLYVGLKRVPGEPDFDPTNLWIYGDPDHDAALSGFEADPNGPFPVLFISFPSAKDPTFEKRYPGHSTIEVVAPVHYRWFQRWAETSWKRRGLDYDEFKQNLANRLLRELERHVPATRSRIKCHELSTPLSTRHFANYPQGEIYGLSATPARFRLRSIGARTPVRNLFLTGQDAAVPGVTGAMFGGVIAASLVLHRNLMSVVSKGFAETGAASRAA
ncbi:MAG: NAD(P)/FAD-dependent oxidoreductase [Acidobacteriia bacterium]|nr:NAD(P)/FAD-dependent oxidoreductase [Terriglobia bacterium]